ncbi:hypothetical protein L593_05295 [Salinarchaeum sp. Harcht-Bsk1]|uniref:HalOD1 output domain-containing protein n=1 Tax=Salinarchaeum sp. Harcht-Bsk1 TaxID=1333523 RepID=UPI0003423C05|nr:HalOD1 output domain-containing protein [Salinarchaeum sp. Harcht-Bsk1]AGN01008.1 hypothetical protein L593_05295 [Salinarchaeum sp. Harcht-Bsk1]
MSLQAADGTPIATTTVEQTDSASVVISQIVTDVADETIDDLPTLANSVDPDALDAVFASEGAIGRLTFVFAGYDILLDSSGAVEVHQSGTITP